MADVMFNIIMILSALVVNHTSHATPSPHSFPAAFSPSVYKDSRLEWKCSEWTHIPQAVYTPSHELSVQFGIERTFAIEICHL